MSFANFKSQVAAGNTLQAIQDFQESFENYSQESINLTTLLLSRWRTLEKERLLGGITDDEASARRTTITKDFLTLLDNIYNDFQAYFELNVNTEPKKAEAQVPDALVSERSHGKYIIKHKIKDGTKWSNFCNYTAAYGGKKRLDISPKVRIFWT